MTYTDPVSEKKYLLHSDARGRLAGYYYVPAQERVLFCAASGRWFEWVPDAQLWRREQEWCRLYYEGQLDFCRILPPDGLPLADGAEKEEAEKEEAALKVWDQQREKDWFDAALERCDVYDVTVYPDGSCRICNGWVDDIPLGVCTEVLELDAENARRLFALIGWQTQAADASLPDEERNESFWAALKAFNEDGEALTDLFGRLGISFDSLLGV